MEQKVEKLETQSKKEYISESWKEIGFHRPLGGILYNLIFVFIAAIFGILLSVWLMPNVIFPFPSAMGFQDMTFSMFGLYFTLLDIGVGNSLQRFVADENIKNPFKAIRYLQFFIWFQMISGLGQTTFISVWVITSVRNSTLSYASWFFLIYSTIQFPGMLGVFAGALEAYQQYHKFKLLDFIKYQVFENGMRILFIVIGRWLGTLYPQLGELMGATIGSIIGIYAKDFIAAAIAAHWLRPILKDVDPSWGIKNLWYVQFDRQIMKECLSFGIRAMLPGLIAPFTQYIATLIMVTYLPNYSAILGMFLLGNMLSQMIGTFALNIAPPLSEAYLNGKKKLSANYISRGYRWNGITACFMIGLLFSGAPLLGVIAGDNFGYVVPIIQSLVFFRFAEMYATFHDRVFNGVGKPHYNIVLIAIEQATRITILIIMLIVLKAGWPSLVYSQGLGWVAKWMAGFIILNWKIIKVKINIYQTFIASFLAALVEGLYVNAAVVYLYPPLSSQIGETVAAILLVLLGILTGPFLVFFPFYSIIGGWDDESIRIVERSAEMSGPSKMLVSIIAKISIKVSKLSPLHGKFPISTEGIEKEIMELTETREKKLKEGKE
ncbi:MAG: hypothetical protein ACFFCS_03570 [Candidatus Hodarchaeota archaeon]